MVCHHYTMHTNQHSSGVYGNVGYPCSDTIRPPNMGCCSEVTDEFVGRFGFSNTKQSIASASLTVTVHRPGSRSLF